jgi:hypothetical protein
LISIVTSYKITLVIIGVCVSKDDFKLFSDGRQKALIARANSCSSGLRYAYQSLLAGGFISPPRALDKGSTVAEIVEALTKINADDEARLVSAQVACELRKIVTCIDNIEALCFLRKTIGHEGTNIPHIPVSEAFEGLSDGEICYELERRLETLASHLYSISPVAQV